MTAVIAKAAASRRRPRRQGRYRHQLDALEDMLVELDGRDHRAPLPEKFATRLRQLREGARRPLARAGAGLALPPIAPGPVAPGAALVMLLKLRLVLAAALEAGDSALPAASNRPAG